MTDLSKNIIRLMFVRVIFASILFFSTLFTHFRSGKADISLVVLYYLVGFILLLSVFYRVVYRYIDKKSLFVTGQMAVDTLIVTFVIYITGGYYSIFTFLYLVVIIYASMILFLKGGLFVASLSSILYSLLIVMQYTGVLPELFTSPDQTLQTIQWHSILYRVVIISIACFAVAFLSGLLTEQNRKSQDELRAMEANLKRVEKMAYMGEMAAGLAHEIKNPLASLVGSIQMLKEDLRNAPDNERLMEIILRETDRLSTLVNDFLFFARPPAGKPERINLKAAIIEIVELFEKDAEQGKKIRLSMTLPENAWVIMDPTHLSQVMWNLLLNAAESIDEDGSIEIRAGKPKNNLIEISVIDTGCGMEPEVVQSIFDPFYTTKAQGTGLGLSIVHRILSAYDSRLDVTSKIDVGSTFSFSILQAA